MNRERALLVDSDTLTKWIFPAEEESEARRPVIEYTRARQDFVRYIHSTTVADLYWTIRFSRDERIEDSQMELAASFYENAEHMLSQWFTEGVFVIHPTEVLSRRWLDLVNLELVHPNANREHAWIVATAQYLRDNRREVFLASEDSTVYQAYKERGLMDDITILRRGSDPLAAQDESGSL